MEPPARRLALAVMVALGGLMALVVAGCSGQATPSARTTITPQASASPPAGAAPAAAQGLPHVTHIAIIVMENHAASAILGNPDAPFINGLADKYALASDYSAVYHPSLPTPCPHERLEPGHHRRPGTGATRSTRRTSPTVSRRRGRTWKIYGESMPAPGATSNAGDYATKHIPFLYYNDILQAPARLTSHVVPFTQLATDLKSAATTPDYLFIAPNLVNDMHDGSVAQGDAWLADQIPAILGSPAFSQGRSLLVLTWDEGSDSDNHVVTIFAGSAARTGYVSTRPYDHYSLLRTVEASWGLAPLTSNDAGAQPMSELLKK